MSSIFVARKRAIQYTAIAEKPNRINKGSNRLCPALVAAQNARGASKTVPFELKSASWRVFIRQVGAFSFGKLAKKKRTGSRYLTPDHKLLSEPTVIVGAKQEMRTDDGSSGDSPLMQPQPIAGLDSKS